MTRQIQQVRMNPTLRKNLDVRIHEAEQTLVNKGWSKKRVHEYLAALCHLYNEPQAVTELENLVAHERSFIRTRKKVYATPIA